MNCNTRVATPVLLGSTGMSEKVVVSKRSARLYFDYDMEKQPEENEVKRAVKKDESDERHRQSSATTSTTHSSQSSLEPSPMVRPADGQLQVDTLVLEPQRHRQSDLELRDAFHPPTTKQRLAYSVHDLERNLPVEDRPVNFGIVVPGVYRSSFPQSEDYSFVEGLKLKTIVTLVRKDFPQGYDAFLHKNDIKHVVFDMKGTKKEAIPTTTMKAILRVVLDRRNHPLLIHCNHGKHRTGCVVGVVRKLSGWNLNNVIDEYKTYAEPKARECDINYISGFELANISNLFRETNAPFRTTSFLRATVFSLVMLIVWFVSGPTIARDMIAEGPRRD
ncbi:putative tyrosine-protein phosphatase [Chaetomidium leptoderma]|uniref:diphosphoinositol-polyphosphate diphosphatase n=1 Tax=Chaetomidium leptoderma TaxID=669021 RepID=A0AAN6VVQ0_9PEZI|nr:putative tyrosine-protein phosphatase [Chaetomidium leptoderma]